MLLYEKSRFVTHYNSRRLILKDEIPIVIPLCISIEPSDLCNFKCVMCHHGSEKSASLEKPYLNMDMKCLKK